MYVIIGIVWLLYDTLGTFMVILSYYMCISVVLFVLKIFRNENIKMINSADSEIEKYFTICKSLPLTDTSSTTNLQIMPGVLEYDS